MIIDKFKIFNKIAKRLQEEYPEASFWVRGSRTGLKKGNRFDFDILIGLPEMSRREYMVTVFNGRSKTIQIEKEFADMNIIDEFGNPVKVDISFTQDVDRMEPWRRIVINN